VPFRHRFACLWCGTDWQVRSDGDLEGWAGLCPECLGRADDNGFLRFRLRTALRERAEAAAPDLAPDLPAAIAVDRSRSPAHDDWYLRRGRFSRGPLHDGPWTMELDEVTRWLDGLPIGGTIVELAAGTGWWSALLAEKGELWLYDTDDAALEAARKRLVSHGLLAHLHQRDPLAAADKQVDVVMAAYLMGGATTEADLRSRIDVIRSWLKPGGLFVFVEAQPASRSASIDGPAGSLRPRSIETLSAALVEAHFQAAAVSSTQNAFIMGRATASA
jgi:SAM-dependent methyltransferase